jgi:hypothetical protein
MVQEAEKYKAEDYVNKNRVEAIGSEELKDKIPANEKSKPDAAIDGTISWLDANAESEKEEFEEKQKAALKPLPTLSCSPWLVAQACRVVCQTWDVCRIREAHLALILLAVQPLRRLIQ